MINRKMIKRLFFIAAGLAIINSPSPISAQMSTCSRPKVAVKLVDLYADKDIYDVLIRQYPYETKEYWKGQIEGKALEKLRANSPGVEIFPADSGSNYDYIIRYFVNVIGCGQQEKIGDLLASKDICYWAHGTIYSNDACGLEGVGFKSSTIQNKDVFTAITLFALGMGNLSTITAQHERERPIPPRGPQIRISAEPTPVSPLDGERETLINARVTNCRGEPVYDKIGERYGVIAGPHETKRGRTNPPVRGTPAFREGANMWLISPDSQGTASLKYKLEKGIKPGKEQITFIACGLDTKVEIKQTIEIEGLEIAVRPQKIKIKPGEDTRIDIEFVKVSAKGEKKPISGKEIALKIDGIKDGVVNPKDKVSTNTEGRALLTYHAGQNDKGIRITATYQPQNFADKAVGSAVITVQEGEGDLSVQINGSLNWTGEDKDRKGTITTSFTINGTMSLHKQKHGGDYENYEIENLQMTYSHHAQFHNKKTDKNCPDTLFWEVLGEGFVPIQKGRIIIRYPRDKAGKSSSKQGEFDLQLTSGALPVNWKFGCGGNQTKDSTTSISVGVFDQKSSIVRNQQEFSGSRTFGISDLQGAFNLAVAPALSFTFNDNESKEISNFPFMPQELEKAITEKGGTIEQMRNLGLGIKKDGNDGRLTWKIKKIKKP